MPRLLDILLQRNDSDIPWGFRIRGGLDCGCPPVISSVTFGTLASQYLNAGDKILEIEKQNGGFLLQSEINRLLQSDGPTLHLLVEKLPPSNQTVQNRIPTQTTQNSTVALTHGIYEVESEHEWIKEKQKSSDGKTQSTKIWLRESNKNPFLGEYDLEVNFERTKYKEKGEPYTDDARRRVQMLSEDFDKIFKKKIGEWMEGNMLGGYLGKQQSSASPVGDGPNGAQPPPPPPGFPGALPGRRIKSEMPERGLEPPSVIQNAMMTKDKKPFTYTPGGIDLSEIRSPKMARRLNRNACADEMPGIPAPTTSQNSSGTPSATSHYSALQSQLPAQVLPPVVTVPSTPPPPPPPPPPPLPSGNASEGISAVLPVASPASAAPASKPAGGRPPLGFDPNELLARVNKTQPYVPSATREEVLINCKVQSAEEKSVIEPKQQIPNEVGQKIHVPLPNEPGHIYVSQAAAKIPNEPPSTHTPSPSSHQTRGQLGSIYIPPVAQEQNILSPSTPYGYKMQQNSSTVASPPVETKPQAPWVTVYRTPQSSASWANREPESPKPISTRIIPIKVEGRDSPKPTTPTSQPQSTPPPFLQSQQMRQMQQQQSVKQQTLVQPQSNARVIPIQIEGQQSTTQSNNTYQQMRSQGQGYTQNKFNPMAPQSPTPFSPSQDKDQKPQWAPVQPRSFKKEPEATQQRAQQTVDVSRPQQSQPEYGTYNTAGVPLSQLRKMQLNDDDRALMDKFKSQVERQGNEILNDENSNPRYRGGYIPSRVFKALDESVDDEKYLHSESDPRYRGACIPSRAFRMLQCMTDTAGDNPQQVPKSSVRGPSGRALSGDHFQQDSGMGPYVPPSEQQAHEPRKYTGGSIPSRSFRMLQAMTGQEVSASSGPPGGRETPGLDVNRWCPSPSPSIIDPFWGFYPPDPYFIYNYISDLSAAYGFPPPPLPYSPYAAPPTFHPSYHHAYQNFSSDIDEQGYSSTDELAQYYANYRRTFGYSPYTPNQERFSTPNPFNSTCVCVSPVQGSRRVDHLLKDNKSQQEGERKPQSDTKIEVSTRNSISAEDEMLSSTDDETESDTEIEEEENGEQGEYHGPTNTLQTLKSVTNLNVYKCEGTSSVDLADVDAESSEEEREVKEEPVPHQLSVIFEESEHSDLEGAKRPIHDNGPSNILRESEICLTLERRDDIGDDDGDEDDNDNDDDGDDDDGDDDDEEDDDDSNNGGIDAESSVTVRLPLKVKFSRTDNDEGIATVIVGDSQMERDTLYTLNVIEEPEKVPERDSCDSDEADVSVTFTLPTLSRSLKSIGQSPKEHSSEEKSKEEFGPKSSEIEDQLTVQLISNITENNSAVEKTEARESPFAEDDSSSTSMQSGDTVLKHKEDTDEDSENDERPKLLTFKPWLVKESGEDDSEDLNISEDMEVEEDARSEVNSRESDVGQLKEMISTLLETTRDTASISRELPEKYLKIPKKSNSITRFVKKESQEESEEDDSGVTSDMSIKQVNSETDADTESDYSELNKMTKFQRASTHSRLFKLLQEECERCGNEMQNENATSVTEFKDNIAVRKQKLTLPLNPTFSSEVDSLSSSSGFVSPSSPTVNNRLVKELIHSLLNKKKGKKFRKLPLARLQAAAFKILHEERDPYDTSPTSGDDGLYLNNVHKKQLHSELTARFMDPGGTESECLESVQESIYGENYRDYLDYYDTWENSDGYWPGDRDIVPSRTFRMLREQTFSPRLIEGFKARCPRVASKKNIPHSPTAERKTPAFTVQDPKNDEPQYERITFAEKQEKVSKVLEKSVKS